MMMNSWVWGVFHGFPIIFRQTHPLHQHRHLGLYDLLFVCTLSSSFSRSHNFSRLRSIRSCGKKNAGWLTRNCNSTMRNALKHLKNLDHLHHLNDFVSKTTPIALRPILGPKKQPGRRVTPSWRFCNRDFNLVLGMNLLGALRSWKQMKQKDELCRARYSEMSDNTFFNTFHFFKSRALQHPAFRTCPKQLVRAPNVHSVSRTCCSAAAHYIFLAQLCPVAKASRRIMGEVLPCSSTTYSWYLQGPMVSRTGMTLYIYSDPWKNGHVQSCDPFCSYIYIYHIWEIIGGNEFHGISMFREFFLGSTQLERRENETTPNLDDGPLRRVSG